MVRKGQPHPGRGFVRPGAWVTGPDPVVHKKYRVFIQQKNQANYREEHWTLTFEDWCELWAEHWDERGRERGQYCMSRQDWSLPWNKKNTIVITREEHARMQGEAVKKGWRSPAQKRYRERKGLEP